MVFSRYGKKTYDTAAKLEGEYISREQQGAEVRLHPQQISPGRKR